MIPDHQSINAQLIMPFLLFLIITGVGMHTLESNPCLDQTHSTVTNPPSFVSPFVDTPTILCGSEIVTPAGIAISLDWRLFSPNISVFQSGNFWISFDLNCNTTDGFEDVIVELVNPDDTTEPGGIQYGDSFVWSAIINDGVFIQYTGFRNTTYFFMNDTYPTLTYPKVADSMLFRLKIIGPGYSVYLFNTTISTETLHPSIEILEPSLVETETGSIIRMNNESHTITANASDQSGLDYAALYGWFENISTSRQEFFQFDVDTNIESDTPFELTISIDSLLDYSELTNQIGENLITIDAVLMVSDVYGMVTHYFFEIAFTLKNTTTESNPLPNPILDNLPFIGVALVCIATFFIVVLWKSRR